MDLHSIISTEFDASSRHEIEVAEWKDETGEPLKFTYTAATVKDVARANALAEGDQVMAKVRLVALKLCDEKGERVFKEAEAAWMADHIRPTILLRLANAIAGEANAEETEKK